MTKKPIAISSNVGKEQEIGISQNRMYQVFLLKTALLFHFMPQPLLLYSGSGKVW